MSVSLHASAPTWRLVDTVTFDVIGTPAQQSGSRAVPTAAGARLISTGGKNLRDWRSTFATCARVQAMQHGRYDGPLHVSLVFRFPMPKSRPKAVRDAGQWPKTTAPDIDKLTRAGLDALTASGLIEDDARVCSLVVSKHEVDTWTGCSVTVGRLELQ